MIYSYRTEKEHNMETIEYKLREVTGSAASGKGRYKADMAKPQVVEMEDFIEIMARSTRQSTIDARFAVNAVSETIQMLLNEGITVKLDLVKFKPALKPAAFETVDADLSEAKIVGSVLPTRKLAAQLRLKAENVLKIPRLQTHELCGDGFHGLGHIAPGFRICYNVEGLKINLENEDEGIYLEDNAGNVVAKARITEQHFTYILFYFDGDIKPGSYRLSYRTRHGMGPDHALITQYWSHPIHVHDPSEVDPNHIFEKAAKEALLAKRKNR